MAGHFPLLPIAGFTPVGHAERSARMKRSSKRRSVLSGRRRTRRCSSMSPGSLPCSRSRLLPQRHGQSKSTEKCPVVMKRGRRVEVMSNLRPTKILGEGLTRRFSTLTFVRTFSLFTMRLTVMVSHTAEATLLEAPLVSDPSCVHTFGPARQSVRQRCVVSGHCP